MKKIILKTAVTAIRLSLNALSYISKERAGEQGFKIFSKPRKGKLTAEDEIFLSSAEKETIVFENLNIQTYTWRGDENKKILLAHGWESNSARWKPLIAMLINKNYTVITLDAPAHGASGSKIFTQILYSEMIQQVAKKHLPEILVGHSAGSFAISLFFKKYRPAQIKKIVLLAPVSDNRVIFDLYFNYLGTNARVKSGFYNFFNKKYGNLEELIVSEFAKDFSVKALIIHDKNDDIVPYSQSKKINAAWKNSELILTENLGHSLRKNIVYENLINFLDGD